MQSYIAFPSHTPSQSITASPPQTPAQSSTLPSLSQASKQHNGDDEFFSQENRNKRINNKNFKIIF